MSDLRCPYLGCKKPIPCEPDIDTCPHCSRSINIIALATSQGSTIPVPNRPMDYIQNPSNKGKVDFQIIKEEDIPEGGSLPPRFLRH